MRARCNNTNGPNYATYGGRGIKVCERWNKYENFLEDMGECPPDKYSLDRIDNDGDYCPENCRWATSKEQNNNKSNIPLHDAFGRKQTVSQWAEEFGVPASLVRVRLNHGFSLEDALTLPKYTKRSKDVVAAGKVALLPQPEPIQYEPFTYPC